MMGDQNLDDLPVERTEFLPQPRHLSPVDAPAFDSQRSRRVYSEYCDLIISIERPQVIGDVAPILFQRLRESSKYIVQGNVVITRHDDLRLRERIQERASSFELMRTGALREVSGNRDNIRLQFVDGLNERNDARFVDRAEVNVGQVNDGSHHGSLPS